MTIITLSQKVISSIFIYFAFMSLFMAFLSELRRFRYILFGSYCILFLAAIWIIQ